MAKRNIPCIYYPTTVVFVDDNKSYLQNIGYNIGRHILAKTYSDPEEALLYIQKSIEKNHPLKNIVTVDEESSSHSHTSTQVPLQYNISKIYEHIYEKNRFSEISVVAVDYAMPIMNGEEFSRKLRSIKESFVKIIMLTGEADHPMAIKLFNDGIIDKFLTKGQENLDNDLKNAIEEMQKYYFEEMSTSVINPLSCDKGSSLSDLSFVELFNEIFHRISATSYYLTEPSGSFIFLNNDGTPKWLIIKTLDELQGIAELMEDMEFSPESIKAVRNGDAIPYFGNQEDAIYSEEAKGEQFTHKAEKLTGKATYCYALLDELPGFAIDKKKIFSFKEYFDNLNS
jgi:CheY-like chemotaxis protein